MKKKEKKEKILKLTKFIHKSPPKKDFGMEFTAC